MKTLKDQSRLYLLLYMNDILIACRNRRVVQELKAVLSQEFEMKDLGLTRKILSMEILWDRAKGLPHLSQGGYI